MSDYYGAYEDGARAGYNRGVSRRARAIEKAYPLSVRLSGTFEDGTEFSYVVPARESPETPGRGEIRLSGTFADGSPFSYVTPSKE